MKSNKTKSAMTALVVAAMLCTAAMPVKAAESQWVNSNGTWTYVKADGSKATGWIKEDGCWYAFDANGAMRTGWIASNEHWYFMGESGVMQSDAWVEDNGAKYYIKGTGVMAKDYVKDGYELTSDGKAIPLAESSSVVVTDPAELEGKVIEGNLYVDVTTAKELELKGVTVKGKLVVLGDNETAGKVTLTDSKVETINTQTRNAEVVLSGKTEVKNVVIEETAKVTPDKNYKGEVENIEVQSTTKGEVVIEVPAENVSTRTYATVDVQAPVGNLEVKTDTQVKVNADVKNVTVTETAKDTTVEVAKGSTVGTITADAPVKIDGKGTVEKVEANVDGVEAGKDTVIKDVETGKDVTEAPDVNKPSNGGGSSSGGGDYTPSVDKTVAEVNSETLFREALNNPEIKTIKLTDNIKIKNKINVERAVNIDGSGYTMGYETKPQKWEDDGNNYVLQFYNVGEEGKPVVLKNITLNNTLAGLFVNGSHAKLENVTINADFGGVELGYGPKNQKHDYSLEVNGLNYADEAYGKASIWVDSETTTAESISDYTKTTYTKANGKTQVHFYKDAKNSNDTKAELKITGAEKVFKEITPSYTVDENGLIQDFDSTDLESFDITLMLTHGETKKIKVVVAIAPKYADDLIIAAVDTEKNAWDVIKAGWGGDGFDIPETATTKFYVIGKAGNYEGTIKIVDAENENIVYCEKTLTINIEPGQVPEKFLDDDSSKITEPILNSSDIDTTEPIQVEE